MHEAQSLINHVALVLDGSGSMAAHEDRVVQVVDDLVRDLALASEEKGQETRVSVYVFDDHVECAIFDMDVMRLPSMKGLYWINGMTALIDATMRAQVDLDTTSQIYGEHAFLTYVITDGAENSSGRPTNVPAWAASTRWTQRDLMHWLTNGPVNSTIAFLVPDQRGVDYVTRLGASPGNVMKWDTASTTGVMDVGTSISTATRTFMDNRARGVHSSRGVFDTSAAAVNAATVSATLHPMDRDSYEIIASQGVREIRELVQDRLQITYRKGIAYYQIIKPEKIQPQKQVIVVEKATGQAYGGNQARSLVGLPPHGSGMEVKVTPSGNPDYDVYIQSESTNRKVLDGQQVLVRV